MPALFSAGEQPVLDSSDLQALEFVENRILNAKKAHSSGWNLRVIGRGPGLAIESVGPPLLAVSLGNSWFRHEHDHSLHSGLVATLSVGLGVRQMCRAVG